MLLHPPEVLHLGTSLRSTARLTGTHVDESMSMQAPIDRQPNISLEPFVPAAVVIATVHGETELVIEGQISEVLLAGARAAAAYFAMHLGLPPVQLVASTRSPAPVVPSLQQVGIFFSRGVDSTSNLVLADRGQLDPHPDVAIVIEGIEPANPPDVEAAVNAKTVEVARSFGLDDVRVSTDLRLVMDRHIDWINAFGAVLAGVGLFLAPRLSDAIISSAEANQQRFSGSHPRIDPLWGNGLVRFHHLPADVDRSERVRLVVEDGRAIEFLRVCVRGGVQNCGRCDKCLQTAVLISAYGGDPTEVFVEPTSSAQDLRNAPPDVKFRHDFVQAARAGGEDAAADAITEVLDMPAGRPSPSGLRAAADRSRSGRGSHDSDRPIAWLALGAAGPELAEIVEHAATAGEGCVLGEGEFVTEHVTRAAMRRARVTVWSALGAPEDGRRAVDCLRSGSRPLIIHPREELDLRRADLPVQLSALVGSIDDVARVIAGPDAGGDLLELGDHLTSGGHGWMR